MNVASPMQSTMHVYEVRPRKDKRGFDLISVVLLIRKRVRNETNRWYCVAGGWCLPVRVGLFHEADFPFRIHFCGFGNCVTPRRRGAAFHQRSVLIQIRTPLLNFRSAPIPSPVVRRAGCNQQCSRLRKVLQPLTSRCDSRLR